MQLPAYEIVTLFSVGGMRRLVLNEQIVIFRRTHRNLANILYLGGLVANASHRVYREGVGEECLGRFFAIDTVSTGSSYLRVRPLRSFRF